MSITKIISLAKKIRMHSVEMIHKARSSHLGSCLSFADILAVLYGKVLNYHPDCPDDSLRDRVLISKGHASAAVYAALAESGFFAVDLLQTFYSDGSRLPGHICHKTLPGIEISTGSLGHGLPVGVGKAFALKKTGSKSRCFVLASDGEMDEGSNWEAVLFAGHHKLDNLFLIIDYNHQQAMGPTRDILDLEPFASKLEAFRWNVIEVDGHDLKQLINALEPSEKPNMPTCVIANTVKGKGVLHMEDDVLWHYRYPREDDVAMARQNLECQ
ncbi:MAG: transketolase [Candidatus Wallbacteria bacterium HGW-Wallbacteria-1]|uniref:Transketolase n=1 Tax=Candidatus Wallbacteria bacterium HGW-Wallbacteria-1 TaxID=2013854 RepID=A0A2N1PP33_9BACT|nr:MAG: transketolase [Candidatus Wallbacteria bacterium HGW-Wallbacteria-1]